MTARDYQNCRLDEALGSVVAMMVVVLTLERDSKMSRVLDKRRENWRGVRRGVFEGAEGKMEMWRGLFWGFISLFWKGGRWRGRESHVFADYA